MFGITSKTKPKKDKKSVETMAMNIGHWDVDVPKTRRSHASPIRSAKYTVYISGETSQCIR